MGTATFRKATKTVVKNTAENFDPFDISGTNNVFLFAKWTGTGTGTLKLQYTPDGVNYKDVASSSQVIAAAGNYYWDIVTGANQVRVVAAETGNVANVTVDVWGYAKGF